MGSYNIQKTIQIKEFVMPLLPTHWQTQNTKIRFQNLIDIHTTKKEKFSTKLLVLFFIFSTHNNNYYNN